MEWRKLKKKSHVSTGGDNSELGGEVRWQVTHTRSGLADAERTKSGIELMLDSDGAYELVSERFFFAGRRSIEDSLGTRFNDISGCYEKGDKRYMFRRSVHPWNRTIYNLTLC